MQTCHAKHTHDCPWTSHPTLSLPAFLFPFCTQILFFCFSGFFLFFVFSVCDCFSGCGSFLTPARAAAHKHSTQAGLAGAGGAGVGAESCCFVAGFFTGQSISGNKKAEHLLQVHQAVSQHHSPSSSKLIPFSFSLAPFSSPSSLLSSKQPARQRPCHAPAPALSAFLDHLAPRDSFPGNSCASRRISVVCVCVCVCV